MESNLYEGSHRKIFELFLKLVDDSEAQTAALLDLVSWEQAGLILSVGGGEGHVEATLLRHAPRAKLWYLDPSSEQCQAFRRYMGEQNLLDRVADIAERTFQDYAVGQQFNRIVSMFSWFYIGTDRRWLEKLLSLLDSSGTACIILPNSESIEADINRNFSPDVRTTLVSEDVVSALQQHECRLSQHSYTKWLAVDELFDGEQVSEASLAFAAFVGLRPIESFTQGERREIRDLLNARQTEEGIPLIWDVVLVEKGQS